MTDIAARCPLADHPRADAGHARPGHHFGRSAGGIAAIGVKELRGRMRGRRAFAILTIYLLLLAGFALMIETLIERSYTTGLRLLVGVRQPGHRPGHLRRPAHADDPAGRLPRPVVHRRGDQPGAREADPGAAHRDAHLVARHRRREAALGARLRLPAHRGVDPADGRRVRVRRRRAGGRAQRLHRADRHRPGLGSFGLLCSSLVKRTTAGDGDHDLRRAGRDHRDGLHPRLLGGDGPLR